MKWLKPIAFCFLAMSVSAGVVFRGSISGRSSITSTPRELPVTNTFALVSDIHVGRIDSYLAGEPATSLHYMDTNFSPSYIVNTGDCADHGPTSLGLGEYATFLDLINTNIAAPFYAIPGNHDNPVDHWESVMTPAGFPTNSVFTNGNWVWILFNTDMINPTFVGEIEQDSSTGGAGKVTIETVSYVSNQCYQASLVGRKIIWASHIGYGVPISTNSLLYPGYGLEELMTVRSNFNVAMWVFGHSHITTNAFGYLGNADGSRTLCLNLPAFSRGSGGDQRSAFNVVNVAGRDMVVRQILVNNQVFTNAVNHKTNFIQRFIGPFYGETVQ